jgi:hypothetical protein
MFNSGADPSASQRISAGFMMQPTSMPSNQFGQPQWPKPEPPPIARGWMYDPSSQPQEVAAAASVTPSWELGKQTLPSHEGVKCDGCNVFPLKGIRYKCANCPNWDLCQICFEHDVTVHVPTHCFILIKNALPLEITNSRRFTATPLIANDLYTKPTTNFGF